MKEFHATKKDSLTPLDSTRTLNEEANGLLTLLNEMDPGEPLWSGDDLTTILDHQLQAPLIVDLGSMQGVDSEHVRQLASARGLVLRSFEDLLGHSNPPLQLLVLTKEFAKRNLISPRSAIPREVARILYFSCIASAMVHSRKVISQLGTDELMEGFSWCLQRPWLKPELQEMFEQAGGLLVKGGAQ